MAEIKARALKKGMQKVKFGRKGKAVVVGPGSRYEDGSRRSRAGESAMVAERKARTVAVNAKAKAKNTAPKASARARAVASPNARFNRPASKLTQVLKRPAITGTADPVKSLLQKQKESRSKPTRALQGTKAPPKVLPRRTASGNRMPSGLRAQAQRPGTSQYKIQIGKVPNGSVDLLKGVGDAIGQLGSTFGKQQIKGALNNPVAKSGGINKYLKNR